MMTSGRRYNKTHLMLLAIRDCASSGARPVVVCANIMYMSKLLRDYDMIGVVYTDMSLKVYPRYSTRA